MILKVTKEPKTGIGRWIILIDQATWAQQLKKSENKLITEVQIPGFRKGKAPYEMAKKHLSENKILAQAGKGIIPIAYQYALSQKPALMPMQQPDFKFEKCTLTECEVVFEFDLPPEITLGEYRNLKISQETISVSQAEIKQKVKLLHEQFATYRIKETGNLAMGDIAVFDFQGILNNKPIAGGSGKNMELEIGSNHFIPGFEEAMIGMSAGEKKTIEITFPQNYHAVLLKGESVKFAIELHEIKIKTINEDKEELVKDANIPNVTTYEQLLEHIKNDLITEKKIAAKEQFLDDLLHKIIENSNITIPNFAIQSETDRLLLEFERQLAAKDYTFDDYKAATKLTDVDIRTEIEKDAISYLQNYLVIEEIIKKEDIQVSDEEVEDHIKSFATQFEMSIAKIKEKMKEKEWDLITSTLKRNKVYDLLLKNNYPITNGSKK